METPLILSGLVFLSIFLFFLGLHRFLTSPAAEVESRLDRYATRQAIEAAADTEAGQKGLTGALDRVIASRSGTPKLMTELARADLKLTPGEFIAINFISVVAGFALAFFLGHNSLAFALVGAIVGFYLPRLYVRQRQARRLQLFNNQLSDTLVLLANTLRSGYSLLQAMETVSHELSPPVSEEFARVTREIGLGLTIEEALNHMVQRINSEDLDLIITAINIQHEVGGNLAEILDTIAHTVRERIRVKGQIMAMTGMQRLSGNIIALLPVALGAIMFVISPKYISNLFTDTCGMIMVGTGATTIVIGYLLIRKIVAIEV